MALAVLTSVLTACSSGHSAPRARPPAPIPWKPCPTHAGWQCGTLPVPIDHGHPGATIDLAVTRHPATDAAGRVGALLVNPGGPGASALDFAYAVAGWPIFAGLVREFDIVAFDPRGVGRSAPIRCVDGPALDRFVHAPPAPRSAADLATEEATAKELANGCASRSPSLIGHVSTVDVARDMDDVRAALGEPKLTYLGFSYGTYLGAIYAELFPTRVRAMSLDSAVDPAIDEGTMSIAQAVGFEQNLNAFLSSCGTGCAFKPHGYRTLRASFDALMARIAASPIPVGTRSLGAGEALLGVAAPLYAQSSWPLLSSALEDAWHGDGSTLLALTDDYTGRHADGTFDNMLESNTATNCLDHPVPTSIAGFQSLAATAAKQAPFFGAPLVWDSLPCLYWPVPPVSKPERIHAAGAPPILVVGTTGDPATPYLWAEHLAGEFDDGILVTRDGDGHGAYPVSQCVRSAVDDYLIRLVKPQALTCGT